MRGKTILGGVALGAALAVALALAAVFGITIRSPGTRTPPVTAPTTDSAPRTAVQVELDRALLAEAELPPAVRSSSPSPSPASSLRRQERSHDLCQLLVDRPAELAGAVPIAQSSRTFGDARQMLAVFGGDQARTAFARLRTAATGCQARPVRLEKVGDESYAARTPTGYLALVRVGSALTVLRLPGPAGGLRERDLTRILHRQRGKLEVCLRCVLRSPRWTRPSATSPATPH